VNGCAWSPDGSAVLSASGDGTVRVWDARTGKVLHVLSGHTGLVFGCAWSPDGSAVLSASADGTLRVWDIATGRATLALLTPWNGIGAAVDLTRNVLITDAGDAWRHWRWMVQGQKRTLPLEAFTAP
jgi:WD40 repeat protein